MTDPLQQAAQYIARSIYWDGEAPGSRRVQRETVEKARQEIKDLWEQGHLPFRLNNKTWVVGFYFHLSFSGFSYSPITTGPAQPTKYRDNYVKVTTG